MPPDEPQQPSLLEFPSIFPIKIMGKSSLEFQAQILDIVRKHVPDLGEAAVDTRYSKDHNYISITVTINATSREQLDALYRDLTAAPNVVMVI